MPDRLNILQITTHDSGRHFGCYGHRSVQTPVIDRVAADGVQFTNCFCTAPISSASRCSQLTGLYPQTHGLLDLTGFGWQLNDDVLHASQIFKAAGYRTLLFGVQHEAADPTRLGFDVAKPDPNNAEAVAESVTAFLRNDTRGQPPFYAQIGFFETHTPFDHGSTAPDTERGVELFDLQADPAEFNNLADRPKYTDVQHNLDTMLWKWLESVDDPLLKGPVKTPTYTAAMRDYDAWRSGHATAEPAGPCDASQRA